MTRLKRLFTAWKDGGKDRGGLPPPDTTQPVRTDSGRDKVVEVVSSQDGRHRVAITKGGGMFRLYPETWAPDWETLGVATWCSNGGLASVADSLETARDMARDAVRAMGGEPDDAPEDE
jgi:hypothetical protein